MDAWTDVAKPVPDGGLGGQRGGALVKFLRRNLWASAFWAYFVLVIIGASWTQRGTPPKCGCGHICSGEFRCGLKECQGGK
jgi:hypothetical protein